MLTKYLSDIGKMDRIITLKREVVSETNQFGETTATTMSSKVLYAALSFDKKDENEDLNKQSQFSYLYFLTRYTDIIITDKIVYNGKDYDVVNIEEIGRQRFLKIKVKLFE